METERGVPNILGGGLVGVSLLFFAVAVADLTNVLDAPLFASIYAVFGVISVSTGLILSQLT
ncbi:hypothetical protein E6P09_08670 [Haloferax mediterranei ATCC 33500]|uniref:Uncharacterized protein n=1 Tax=Haloferax mediterranei (strain ATCC 33500 / DSM 1411 / JCM 8866 / NBRC 14739 / NCIMB 2177 / R-4) TaxID=523841 RepID=I3R3N6_HALMT|nr:hypothetical protein [Haloferax mediterranei]AFK18846.1 hypothetical protein HFX_1130 [Haloferax mediterranei ATCC 33500]AHZ21789.1 hypothetical protein BM92_03560 [Haloferax mediterranei ATCC 33500]EMA03296.1 hypothetical protein C439_04840 [Haloferax mediterranei ATCC 33500]MDX5988939.1 hypothetical protein [Haloferax mediterranei ATCC 33500]QCQ75334.1 hypothetical protein E6P09_08670 [Haloferax mediterranei ATCC 33500]